jgi:hypothetical protein
VIPANSTFLFSTKGSASGMGTWHLLHTEDLFCAHSKSFTCTKSKILILASTLGETWQLRNMRHTEHNVTIPGPWLGIRNQNLTHVVWLQQPLLKTL